jgi:hypothetical protein
MRATSNIRMGTEMRFIGKLTALAVATFGSTGSLAQGVAPDGAYSSNDTSLRVIILGDAAQTVVASTTVVQGARSGRSLRLISV